MAKGQVFRFQLLSEPESLNPAKINSNISNYFFSQLFEGLYVYDNDKGLIKKGAESCIWKTKLQLICKLNPKKVYNDGSKITAEDYVRSFRHLIDPDQYGRRVDLLFKLKNAKNIFDRKLPPQTLGIKAKDEYSLEFNFSEVDADFLFKLSSPVLVPWKKLPDPKNLKDLISNGPFQIKTWTLAKITLEPNPYYDEKITDIHLEARLINEDSSALNLYETGLLDFLIRIPPDQISALKSRNDYITLPLARFDYLGLNGDLEKYPLLREAMAYALDYEKFKTIFSALGRPGCPSMPETYFTKYPCYSYDIKRAKNLIEQVPIAVRKQRRKIYYSSSGGDIIKQTMEWFQHQWKKNLDLDFEIIPLEYKMMNAKLKEGLDGVFRRGIPLDRPSCLAGIENFHSKSPENFLKLKSKSLDKKINQLASQLDTNSKKLCTEAVQDLLEQYRYIPLGRIHFSMLMNPKFKSWRLNELNQLDLRKLQIVDEKK
ncbi:MAG: ABC transporter substrate-binding protein [Bdellovibrionota bacterium]|nr:ABC transporter substrate-binding protein [Bdellovibrionota bacterium]